jgi:hypothetical protein
LEAWPWIGRTLPIETVPAEVAQVTANVRAILSYVCPIPGDVRRTAKSQITAKLSAVAAQVDPVANDVPAISANVRANKAAGEGTSATEAALEALEVAVKATGDPAAPASGGRVGRNQDAAQDGRGGESDDRSVSHTFLPFDEFDPQPSHALPDGLKGAVSRKCRIIHANSALIPDNFVSFARTMA